MNVFIGRVPLFTRIWKYIAYRNQSTSIILLHVASQSCAKQIFNIAGSNAAEYKDWFGRKYIMCGKLLIWWRINDVKDIAYVIDKDTTRLYLQTTGNKTSKCSNPRFVADDNNNGTFDLELVTDGRIDLRCFYIQEYRPICIRLHRSSSIMQITMNRLVYDDGENDTLILIGNECTWIFIFQVCFLVINHQ